MEGENTPEVTDDQHVKRICVAFSFFSQHLWVASVDIPIREELNFYLEGFS